MAEVNINPTSKPIFCCDLMKTELESVCEIHPDRFDCPDNVIYFSKSSGEYGLIIHDGGSSFLKINFCPFCGILLQKND
jgi:hypothetical protein